MTRYLLDTTALIDFSKNREPARSRILRMISAGDDIGVCAINAAEFYTGVPPAQRPLWDEFFASLGFWEIGRDTARQAGVYRYDFARRGIILSTTDAMVAAVAKERGAVLVTNNLKDYPMSEIELLALKD
jgi:tRNA(fMet)-specific endonuclease VapC